MGFLDNLSDSDDDVDENTLFNHAERNFNAILREQTTRKAARRTGQEVVSSVPPKEKSKSLKRKSDQSEEVNIAVEARSSSTTKDGANRETLTSPRSVAIDSALSTRQSPIRHNRTPSITQAESANTLDSSVESQSQRIEITILDDDENGHHAPADPQGIGEQSILREDDTEDSEDEFAEIARQARLAHRRKLAAETTAKEPTVNIGDIKTKSEPKIEIFLSSELPGTTPLRVFVRLSQALGEVRKAWLHRQEIPASMVGQVYLTYRRRRVYDTSTCRSLGLEVNDQGVLVMKGAEDKHDVDKVHLEAVTDALLESIRSEATGGNDIDHASNQVPHPLPAAATEPLIRLILRTAKVADYKLKVKSSTSINKIASGYKRHHNLDPSCRVTLLFDGDELDPDLLVGETEISDMDQLEVKIK